MDLDQVASGVTTTLTVRVHPRLNSKRPQDHAAQGPATILSTLGRPRQGRVLV